MNMEKLNNMNELEEMRQQIQALKNKVDRQGVLNEQLVRKSLGDKMKDIHHTVRMLIVMVVLATPLWVLIKYQYNLSFALLIFTLLMMYVSVFFDWHTNRMEIGMNDDLKETAQRLMEMKKRRALQEKIAGFIIMPIWAVWMVYEFYHNITDRFLAIALIIGAAVGAIIGGCIGLNIYFKWQRKNDEMIQQIEELTKEEE